MASGSTLFDEYGAYHRDRRNLICHEIGIPLIVLGIIALLRMASWPGNVNVNLASIAIVAAFVYYVALGPAVRSAALVALVGMLLLYFVAGYLTWPYAIDVFVVGWIFQFVGHAYEGKSPAFLTNLLHLLVGPLWVASHLVPKSISSSSAR